MKKGVMYSGDLNQEEPGGEDRISRSRIKRECQEVTKFTEKLCSLTKNQLNLLVIPEDIREEVDKAYAIKSPVAKARQIKFTSAFIRESGEYESLLSCYRKNFR